MFFIYCYNYKFIYHKKIILNKIYKKNFSFYLIKYINKQNIYIFSFK